MRPGPIATAFILWEFLDALTRQYGVDIYTPYKDLPEEFKQVLLYGSGDNLITFYFERDHRRISYQKPFEGLIPNLERRYRETDSSWVARRNQSVI